MKKYRINKLINISVIWLLIWIFFWLCFSYWFVVNLRNEYWYNFTDESILMNIFTSNYQEAATLIMVCGLPFLLLLNYYLYDDGLPFYTRFNSRSAFVLKNALAAFLFSLVFAFLHELVSIVGSTLSFGFSLVLEKHLLQYSVLNTLSICLYFFRISLMVLCFRAIVPKKYAHYIVFIIYLAESYALKSILNEDAWLPCDDAVVIGNLLSNSMNYIGSAIVLLRGFFICAVFLMIALILEGKRDVLSNEKK